MYINHRGLVLLKSQLSPEQINNIKTELTLTPKKNHVLPVEEKPVITFRENAQKLYVPRFYGLSKFENQLDSIEYKIPEGDNISIPFVNELRDYQKKIVSIYFNHVQSGFGGGILEVPCGRGKTIMALNIASVLQKKTLILVHKEFLMNQWIERIRDFVPSARVGKIQASVFDIEDKDIVIGMIQTMYKKDYSNNAFNSFGLTIIDEVHRIGSEEFSKTLFKISTAYMLGISATVDRKDGLTDILYMYIGPKIYFEERKDSSAVDVRAVFYDYEDDSYREEAFDFRGKIKYSTMISKISDFPPRKRFLVKILRDLISEDSSKQIMVLSHKRDLLDYLQDGIEKGEFASCGQYVGGMKQRALQETESKQIVLATYAMAAEALDIKTLNTLVMVSPKTDIIQSVGRILRTEGAGKIIVDVVDSHEVFQNQWNKRKTFYRKSNYFIRKVAIDKYKNMENDDQYTTVYDPMLQKSKKSKSVEKKETNPYPF